MSAVCEKTFFCDSFIEEVVVMEDSQSTRDAIKKVIESELSWPVKTVNKKEEAVSSVKNKRASFYILDNWVVGKNDGLDALEQIRTLDEKAFVAILTGHPSPSIKKQAEKLKATFYKEKTYNLENDIKEIALAMVKHQRQIFNEQANEQIQNLIDNLDTGFNILDSDPNLTAYEKLRSDPELFSKYQGKYVAFVDGEQRFPEITDKEKLLQRIREEYPDKPRFFEKVEREEEIIDLPSSYWFDSLEEEEIDLPSSYWFDNVEL